jgi:hypothetical protein
VAAGRQCGLCGRQSFGVHFPKPDINDVSQSDQVFVDATGKIDPLLT